jgi:hypothetical protein
MKTRSDACSSVIVLRRMLVVVVLAVCALACIAPPARADGDPASDVLVYQNLFVAADANIPVALQSELGTLLTSAAGRGFPVRVAVIAQPDDLGAITALWQKPASYAGFLGIELSLIYTGRLLVVMPDGFGFYWHGHSTTAAYQILAGQHIGAGGGGLATAVQGAVLALAAASGVRLTPTIAPSAGGAAGAAGTAPWDVPGLVFVLTLLDLALGAAGVMFAWRARVLRRSRSARRTEATPRGSPMPARSRHAPL